MKFCWVTLRVKNLEESLEFYQKIVGLGINTKFSADEKTEIVFLSDGSGNTQVELICNKELSAPSIGTDISLGFVVNSVEEHMKHIAEKGIKMHSGPFQPNPNTKFFFVLDPNGVKIQFVEQG